jgi:Cu2+-exporting ATPase
LRQLQAQGHRLLMVGDGFNDMPVLAGADVSMAFAQAVPLAQAHADVVALGGRLMAVAQLIALARRTLSVVKGSLIWALTYNLLAIPVAVLGGLPPALAGLGMATSSLWVVLRAMPLNKTPSQTHSV